jgi:hypothetical protein
MMISGNFLDATNSFPFATLIPPERTLPNHALPGNNSDELCNQILLDIYLNESTLEGSIPVARRIPRKRNPTTKPKWPLAQACKSWGSTLQFSDAQDEEKRVL